VFRAEAKGQPLVLDNDGVVGGNEVFKDRGTGSRWQQSSLEAISGPLQGTHLQLYPFLLTSWQEWRRLHPDTLVLKPLPGYADRIADKNRMIREGLSGEGAAPKDVTYHDDRLKPKTMILGLDVAGSSKAFPLEALRQARVVNDTLGGKPVVIVHQPTSDTTTAFVARSRGKTLIFEAANAEASALVDRETGSRWNAYGLCIAGPLKGSRLESLVLEPEYWFAWSEFHRDTAVHARKK
jgi:Protein of unknown function (DUF3179)